MSKGKQDKKRYFIAKSSRTGKPVIGRITQLRNTKVCLSLSTFTSFSIAGTASHM